MDTEQRGELTTDLRRSTGSYELALAPVIFGLLGFLVDRAVGLTPVITIAAALFAFCGVATRLWYSYDREMRSHEEAGPWARRT